MRKKILSLVLVLTVVCSTLASLGITASAAKVTGTWLYTYYEGCDSSMGTLSMTDNSSPVVNLANSGNNYTSSSRGFIFYAKANDGYEVTGFYIYQDGGAATYNEGETTLSSLGGMIDGIPVHDKCCYLDFTTLSSLKVEAKFEKNCK